MYSNSKKKKKTTSKWGQAKGFLRASAYTNPLKGFLTTALIIFNTNFIEMFFRIGIFTDMN